MKKSNAPHGRNTPPPKHSRKQVHAYHAVIIAKEHQPTQWPPTLDLCVGGYRKGKKIDGNKKENAK